MSKQLRRLVWRLDISDRWQKSEGRARDAESQPASACFIRVAVLRKGVWHAWQGRICHDAGRRKSGRRRMASTTCRGLKEDATATEMPRKLHIQESFRRVGQAQPL